MQKELYRRLHAVDPNLTIIPGGRRYKSKKGEETWRKAAGAICSRCGKEVQRIRDGLCMRCWEQSHEIEIRDTTGITNWLGEGILAQITHLAKREE